METIIKEERYIVRVGYEEHVLRVQELVSGPDYWHNPFRVQLEASARREARTIFGADSREVVEKATDYIRSCQYPLV